MQGTVGILSRRSLVLKVLIVEVVFYYIVLCKYDYLYSRVSPSLRFKSRVCVVMASDQ